MGDTQEIVIRNVVGLGFGRVTFVISPAGIDIDTIPDGSDPKATLKERIQVASSALHQEQLDFVGGCVVAVGVHDFAPENRGELGDFRDVGICGEPSAQEFVGDECVGNDGPGCVCINGEASHAVPSRNSGEVLADAMVSDEIMEYIFRSPRAVGVRCRSGAQAVPAPQSLHDSEKAVHASLCGHDATAETVIWPPIRGSSNSCVPAISDLPSADVDALIEQAIRENWPASRLTDEIDQLIERRKTGGDSRPLH